LSFLTSEMHAAFQSGRGEPLPEAGYEALRRVSCAIAAHHDIKDLFRSLADELRPVVNFVFLRVFLYDEERQLMRLHVSEAPGTPAMAFSEFPPQGTAVGWVYEKQEQLVIPDVDKEKRFPRLHGILKEYGIRSHVTFPLTTAHGRLGTFAVGSDRPNAYSEEDCRFLALVADQIAVAIDDALHLQALQRTQVELEKRNERLQLLLDVNNSIASNLKLRDLLLAISANVRRVMLADFVGVALPDPTVGGVLRGFAYESTEGPGPLPDRPQSLNEKSGPAIAFRTGRPAVLHEAALEDLPAESDDFFQFGMKEGCSLPLMSRGRVLGSLDPGRLRPVAFTEDDVEFLTQIASQVAIAVDNALAYGQIADLKNELAQEKLYLESEIRSEMNFADIVGNSPAIRAVLGQVETVAPTDSTVLLLGETGTGKELMARAIHERSQRQSHAFVKLNCAAIPMGLLESEMFGHEKGAFTGAVAQRIGRFELAHGGTIFLDEIGEIPLELQPKLLRVLQEREFERLGSSRTLRSDARLIAATNCDLQGMVDEKKFRADLYYRLNVFPVFIPPLRERQQDIPMLVSHFTQLFAHRVNKKIETVSTETMNALVRYSWPGNIRELQNVIERAVLLSNGPVLKVPISDLKSRSATAASVRPTPASGVVAPKEEAQPIRGVLEDVERKQILAALEQSHGVVAGPNGAAAKLGLKRSTLQLRMKKLGIASRTVS
jgi:formate hydrogenlyase transcriptional activator